MPVITVQLAAQRSIDVKRRLAASLTDVVAEVLEVPRERITVLIDELGRDNWASGGEQNQLDIEPAVPQQTSIDSPCTSPRINKRA